MEGGVPRQEPVTLLPSLRFSASKAVGRAWGGEGLSLCHCSCPPHNPNTPHVPLAELSGWEEQEGDSTSSIPTSLRSGATAGWFPMGIGSVCFSSLVYFLPCALVCYLGARSQGLTSTRNTSQWCHVPTEVAGLPEPGLRLKQGRRSGGQSRAGRSVLEEGAFREGSVTRAQLGPCCFIAVRGRPAG